MGDGKNAVADSFFILYTNFLNFTIMRIVKRILLIIMGVVSICLGTVCLEKETGSRESYSFYGGDAFTGIQQAGAQSANNVCDLAKITRFGFGSVLLVGGFVLIITAIPDKLRDETNQGKTENTVPDETEVKSE